MSYILDALRKSDQQRRRGAAPTLLAGQAPATAPRQPALLLYGLLALVLLGAGMAIGWLRPWQTELAAPVKPAVQAAALPDAKPRLQVPTETAPQPRPDMPLQHVAPPAPAAPAPALAPAKPHAQAATASAATRPRARAEPGPPPREAAAVEPVGTSPPAQPIVSIAELPLSIQQELPPMTVSVHAYSGNPPDRLVGINNRMLREGDSVVPGLKLEQITPDGMIFSYKGLSFRRGVK